MGLRPVHPPDPTRVPLWNDALVNYLFSADRDGRVVGLGLEKDEIEEAGQLGGITPASVSDFLSVLCNTARGPDPAQLVSRARNLHKVWKKGPAATPTFVAHLVLLVHAVLVGDGKAHDVHGKVNQFLGLDPDHAWDFSKLEPLWHDLEDWANVTLAGQQGRFVPYTYGAQRWVSYLRGQSLLTPRDRARLTWLFEEQGWSAGQSVPQSALEKALRKGVARHWLPQRLVKVMAEVKEAGKTLLLSEVADELAEWDGALRGGAPPHRGGASGRLSARLVLATSSGEGIPLPGTELGPLGLRMRVPPQSPLDLLEGELSLACGPDLVLVESSVRLPQGWSHPIVRAVSGAVIGAGDAGWPGDVRLEGAGIWASRPATERAILWQQSGLPGLVEADDPSAFLLTGQQVVLLARDVRRATQKFPFIPDPSSWRTLPGSAAAVSWVIWTASQDLQIGEFLETARSDTKSGWVQVDLWPRTGRREHLAGVPLLMKVSSIQLELDGAHVSPRPLGSGALLLDTSTPGTLKISGVVGARDREIKIKDMPIASVSHLRVDAAAEAATHGISGAVVDPQVSPPPLSAYRSATGGWCLHEEHRRVSSPKQTASALMLDVLSTSDREHLSWAYAKQLAKYLAEAGLVVTGASAHVGALMSLGHVQQVRQPDGSSILSVAPPFLSNLPGHDDVYVLSGRRNQRFLRDLIQVGAAIHGEVWTVEQELFGWDRESRSVVSVPAPPVVFFQGDADLLRDRMTSASHVTLAVSHVSAAESLIGAFEPISSRGWGWQDLPPAGTWDGWVATYLDRLPGNRGGGFRRRRHDRLQMDLQVPLPTALWFARENKRHVFVVDTRDGVPQYAEAATAEEAMWAACVLAEDVGNVLFYDRKRQVVGVRRDMALPWLLERALVFCSGFLPRPEEFGVGDAQVLRLDRYLEVPEGLFLRVVDALGVPRSQIGYRDLF